jgi:hypothetical protein
LALARPTNESGPVWSAMTPTLMGRPPEVVDVAMMLSFEKSAARRRARRRGRRCVI